MKKKLIIFIIIMLMLLLFIGTGVSLVQKVILGRVAQPYNTFKFQVVYAAPGTFTLPILEGGAGYAHNFTVNWGDGSSDSTITSFDDPDRIHTYAGAGTYDITMIGTCEWFCFNDAGDKTKITKLLGFSGDMGFKQLNFEGCLNLNTIIPLGIKISLTSASYMFKDDPLITSIPNGMYDGCPNLVLVNLTFYGCPGIKSIPVDMFRYNPLITSFMLTFAGTGITSIPANIFRHNPLVTSFNSTFAGCIDIVSELDGDIFLICLVAVDFGGTFKGCLNMTGQGQKIIDNTALPGHSVPIVTADCFDGCVALSDYATLPAGWK